MIFGRIISATGIMCYKHASVNTSLDSPEFIGSEPEHSRALDKPVEWDSILKDISQLHRHPDTNQPTTD
jgi:hypothetical protein